MLRHPYILGDPQCQVRGAKAEMVPNMGEQNLKWLPQPCFFGDQKRAEMLCHPCILGDPQSQVRGAKSEVVPNKRVQNQKWLPHHYLLGGAKEGGNAMLPLHSRRSPTPSAGSKIRSGPPQRGTKSEVAASPLPSQGAKRGQKCYGTRAFSGIPNAKRGVQNLKWLASPLFSRGPKRGQKCYATPTFSGIPNGERGEQNQKWSPTKGNKIRSGYLSPAFSGAQKRAEMLRHACILGDPQHRGTYSEVATSPLPSRGPKRGQKCYVTPAFSGIPSAKRGEQPPPTLRDTKGHVTQSKICKH